LDVPSAMRCVILPCAAFARIIAICRLTANPAVPVWATLDSAQHFSFHCFWLLDWISNAFLICFDWPDFVDGSVNFPSETKLLAYPDRLLCVVAHRLGLAAWLVTSCTIIWINSNFKISVRISLRTHCVFITKTYPSVPFTEMVAVYRVSYGIHEYIVWANCGGIREGRQCRLAVTSNG
jgi:hypothetical protein